MYLFLGGEHVWAAKVYRERLAKRAKTYAWECGSLASLYVKFGDHAQAIEVLEIGLDHLPQPPGRVFTQAGLHDKLGDVHADLGRKGQAATHYRKVHCPNAAWLEDRTLVLYTLQPTYTMKHMRMVVKAVKKCLAAFRK